jgi:uncharacterized OsmC-like protein
MKLEELKAVQAPIKDAYRAAPASAIVRMSSTGNVRLGDQQCVIEAPNGTLIAGLHRAAGGNGKDACSVEVLLDALVACAGVTFSAVATNMELNVESCQIRAYATMDFRGTLGVDRSAPVGLTSVELEFTIKSTEPGESIDKLVSLTERYCVIYQTLKAGTPVQTRVIR